MKCVVSHFSVQGANADLLNDKEVVKQCLRRITKEARFTVLQEVEHAFTPQGVSCVLLLAESHIAIHTWPENASGYITLATCREPDTGFSESAIKIIQESFKTESVTYGEIN